LTSFLFILYLFLFLWFIRRSHWLRQIGLTPVRLIGLYLLKVAAGIAYGYFFTRLPNYTQNADTWRMFFAGVAEKQWLLQDPTAWLADVYTPRYAADTGLLGTENSLLNDVKDVVLIKLISLLNLLTNDSYNSNLLFYNYAVFMGQAALALCWKNVLQQKNAAWLLILIVCWPSTLFWCSGFHRDGLILLGLGVFAWKAWQETQHPKLTNKIWMLIAIALVFFLRNYVAVFAVLAAICFWLWAKWPAKRWLMLLAFVAGFTAFAVLSGNAIPQAIAQRQQAFAQLQGGSQMAALVLDGSWWSLLSQWPSAMLRGVLTPPLNLRWAWNDLPFAVENIVYVLAVLGAFFFIVKRKVVAFSQPQQSWFIAALVIALPILMLIGYTIPFATAIVRYKSILWPMLLPPVMYIIVQYLKHRWPNSRWLAFL